jgi:hypothetical protein
MHCNNKFVLQRDKNGRIKKMDESFDETVQSEPMPFFALTFKQIKKRFLIDQMLNRISFIIKHLRHSKLGTSSCQNELAYQARATHPSLK